MKEQSRCDTHTHIHTHSGVLLSYKKELNLAICSMDEPRRYWVVQKFRLGFSVTFYGKT